MGMKQKQFKIGEKGINGAQTIWLSGCPMKAQKSAKNTAFLTVNCPYVR